MKALIASVYESHEIKLFNAGEPIPGGTSYHAVFALELMLYCNNLPF